MSTLPRILRSTSRVGRLVVTLVSTLALLLSAPVHATSPSDVEHQAEILVEKGEFLAAARLLRGELERLPENLDNRATRNLLVSAAVNVYSLAFENDPKQCEPIIAALSLSDAYLRELLVAHGDSIRSSDAYEGIEERRGELERSRRLHDCPDPTPEKIQKPPPPPPGPERKNTRPFVIGVAISAGLTASMLAISLGTSLSRVRAPFTGAAYDRIYSAAVASFKDDTPNVDYGRETDMCQNGRMVNNAAVINACDSWDRLGQTAIATGVIAGVLAATTLTLTSILLHRKRKQAVSLALVRRHQIFLATTPDRRGLKIDLGFRF